MILLLLGMGSRTACSRPRPVLFEAKAGIFEAKANYHDCWRNKKNDLSHQNPIVKLTTKRLSKHKLSTKLSLSLHFAHQQATVTGGYYIWETQAGWGVFFEASPIRAHEQTTLVWVLAQRVQMLLELTKLSPELCSIWIVASAFSCNHVSSIGTGDDTCPSASSRYAV